MTVTELVQIAATFLMVWTAVPEPLWAAGGAVFGAAIGVGGTLVVALINRQPKTQDAINQGFEKLVSGFLTQMEEHKTEIRTLTGVVRDLDQHIMGLENILRLNGLEIPERKHPHPILAAINGGRA